MQTGNAVTLEVRFPRRFEIPAWQTMRFGPVRTMGEITGLVLLATDITNRNMRWRNSRRKRDCCATCSSCRTANDDWSPTRSTTASFRMWSGPG